ncbi:MAG TPA: YceI family protein [Geopsychrobacteraceae bacterium]|nr:YceI family protein [Geopsychrobacteraceae bacterium]
MFKKILFSVVAVLFTASLVSAATYKVDPVHSQVHFTVAHLVIFKVSGVFTEFSGTAEADPTAQALQSVKATVSTTSIDTRIEKRDNHLRSDDFFASDKYPQMTFVSNKIVGSGNDITIYGDLTIRDKTKEITLKGRYLGSNKDGWGNEVAGFEAKGKINRKDFGLTWNKVLETGGVTVGEDVEIGLEIQAIRQ